MTQEDQSGRILAGRYRVQRPIGQGAHGTVYCAEDLGRSGRLVALKLSAEVLGSDPGAGAAAVLRRFQHPNWATVVDAGQLDETTTFQTSELIAGSSLDHLEGPQPFETVWRLLEDGARVLGALHRHGLIHYDVTPGNVLLSETSAGPRFVLTDGGLAHVGPVEGIARGTPLFMAPEVTQRDGHDHRADLYSLGLVAFRLVTGRDPIDGSGGEVLGKRRRHAAPLASTHRSDVPAELDDLLADLLARDPRKRPEDAVALLKRLDAALARDVPAFLHAEGLAAAQGGPLVDRDAPLERFDVSLSALTKRLEARGKRLAQARAPIAPDAVLLLDGQPGCGASRLSEAMTARARAAGLPCLVMAGREQAGDRRGPLRHFTDGLVTLGVPQGADPSQFRLDVGQGRTVGRDERVHAATRAVEQFVRAVEQAAQRTPFLLVVQDFAELPESAQEAVRVLSRHLLSRRDGGGHPAAVPVLLVVDLGGAEAADLLLPDARDPRQPLIELAGLEVAALERMTLDRFPGFLSEKAEMERVAAVAEGLPGMLVSLLGEACRRGDLLHESGQWRWDLSHIHEYVVQRGLTPAHADALERAGAAERRLLETLGLANAPLPKSLLEELWQTRDGGGMPASPLLRTSSRDGQIYFAPVNLAVRTALLDGLAPERRREYARELLTALSRLAEPHFALDRARLALEVGAYDEALGALREHWSALPFDAKEAAQKLIRQAVEAEPGLLESAGGRERVAAMLEHGQDAAAIAALVAAELSHAGELAAAEAVAHTLLGARRYADALAVLECAHPENRGDLAEDARLWTLKASLQFHLQQATKAREALKQARASLRGLGRDRARHPRLRTEFLMAEAQSRFLQGDKDRASLALRAARIAAKRTRSPLLRSQILNNMGIVETQRERRDEARRCLERSLRLRRVLGDVQGAIKTTLNLGRLRREEGRLVKSASLFQEAAGSARRHAQPVALSRALLLLADVYDQQLNVRLAATTLERATRVAELSGLPVEFARAAWSLAPILAAMGDPEGARRALLDSAGSARNHATQYARAVHHLTAALVATHLGQPDRATLSLHRSLRHADSLYAEAGRLAHALDILLQAGADTQDLLPPAPGGPDTGEVSADDDLAQACLWFEMTMEGKTTRHPVPFPSQAPGGREPTAPGPERRLLAEMILRGCEARDREGRSALLKEIGQRLAHAGEHHVRSRALASRSVGHDTSLAEAAQQFSRALQLLGPWREMAGHAAERLPREHTRAYAVHAASLGDAGAAGRVDERDLHALAHRLIVQAGGTDAPDDRVASALRRVLAATGRMNAGAGLDDLLEGMTSDTIDVTGAERACVVLVDGSADSRVRVATSASAQDQGLDVEDLSQTVIQRVMESQTPLLLHDVFDDEELMGRPSITDLSLRSILCVPMIRSDTLYGVMYADSASAAGSFDQVDLEVLSLFAEQAAAALETHRLVADVQNSMDELKDMQERLVKGERLRTMGELSSGVAHEFNNLLTSILARVQLINLTPVGPELKHDLDLIEKACLDAAEVVRRLQNFSRQQRQGHFVRLDLAEICRDAVEFLRPLWSTRRRHARPPVQVGVHVEENLMVNGDPTELREVVTNLLKNALDALADGGEISIAAQAVDGFAHLHVIDDGPGMSPDLQARIFDPFFTTKGERGTGLGLCLSQQIVERHGGEISVESTPGEGTAFHIELPGAGAVVKLAPLPAAAEEDHTPRMRVLVVDDDANVREPLCRYLKGEGYEVHSAADGEAGLASAHQLEPDVVITDVAMPKLDGLQLCKKLRAWSAELPIVIMSGWSAGVDPTRARRAGATALLGKPFALRQVAELLERVSDDQQPTDTTATGAVL